MKSTHIDPIKFFEEDRMAAKPYNSSEEKDVNNARKAAALREANELETIRTLAQYENGRELLFDFIKCAITGVPTVVDNINATYFNLGQEHKARDLFRKFIKASPKDFVKMVEEHQDEL